MGKKSERQSKDSYDTLYDVGMHGRMEWIDGDCYRDVWRVGLIANNGVCLGLWQVDIRLVPSCRTPSDNDLLMIFPVFFLRRTLRISYTGMGLCWHILQCALLICNKLQYKNCDNRFTVS